MMIYIIIVSMDGKSWEFDDASSNYSYIIAKTADKQQKNPDQQFKMQPVSQELFDALIHVGIPR